MIYDTGRELQTTDFTNTAQSEAICERLAVEFKGASSACAVCWLSSHAADENRALFSVMRDHERELIEILVHEHEEIEKRIDAIGALSRDLVDHTDPSGRVEVGVKLNRAANDLFGYYIAHMNKEEETLVPATWKYFTDAQLSAIRASVQAAMPPERLAVMLRWIISAQNVNEIVGFLTRMKASAPPAVYAGMAQLAEQTLGPDRWGEVIERISP